jgi:hypothetical protein
MLNPFLCPKCRIGELIAHYDRDNKLYYKCDYCYYVEG